jgi:hypothetical protein
VKSTIDYFGRNGAKPEGHERTEALEAQSKGEKREKNA